MQARLNAFTRKQAHLQICEQDLNAETKRDEAKKLHNELNILLEQEEAYWQQRSRVNWLQNANLNTKSFHTCASQRKRTNKYPSCVTEKEIWFQLLRVWKTS